MNQTIRFKDVSHLKSVAGLNKEVLRKLRTLGVKIKVHGLTIKVSGGTRESNDYACSCIREKKLLAESGNLDVSRKPKNRSQNPNTNNNQSPKGKRGANNEHFVAPPKIQIIPKNDSQKQYIQTVKNNDVVFGVGSAGTGKTFLAVALALQELEQRKIDRIIVTRPAVEAGEKLGFLPGSFAEKVDPYLQPIYDAITHYCGKPHLQMMRTEGILEIAPIAYLRGRTFHNAFVILDEAQNCTATQLLMVLTRLGRGSKCVITGDTSQIDLPLHTSGLSDIIKKLKMVDGVGVYEFNADDVVRHPIVSRIIKAVEGRHGQGHGQEVKPARDVKGDKKPRYADGWAEDFTYSPY
jgi:phosphate starvation-inducible PhoH-like protein